MAIRLRAYPNYNITLIDTWWRMHHRHAQSLVTLNVAVSCKGMMRNEQVPCEISPHRGVSHFSDRGKGHERLPPYDGTFGFRFHSA